MIRRRAIAAAIAALAARAAGVAAAELPLVFRGSSAADEVSLAVIYLSAADCPVCRFWERTRRPAFLGSPEGRRAPLSEVARSTIRQPVAERDWPSDLRWVAGATAVPTATPDTHFSRARKILAVAVGTGGFDRLIAPKIRQTLSM